MRVAAILGLLLVIALVSLSSYLRLEHSGIGCTPWPGCYGNIGAQESDPSVVNAYERLLVEALQPMSWARPLHRLVASVLGVLVLALLGAAVMRKRDRTVLTLLLALTVFLAWLGIYSQGLHSKAVVMGNLVGGFTMLGLFGWLVFKFGRVVASQERQNINGWVVAALTVTCIQIFLGGLTSANFAATACTTLPSCFGHWIPGPELALAFDLSATLEVNDAGFVSGGAERAAIHMMHRLFAAFTLIVVLIAVATTNRTERASRVAGLFAAGVVVAEVAIGMTAVVANIPIAIAVAHNWLAGLLLLGLLYLLANTPSRRM
jgi:cytochrome c oxidase assembly protein subunit 15